LFSSAGGAAPMTGLLLFSSFFWHITHMFSEFCLARFMEKCSHLFQALGWIWSYYRFGLSFWLIECVFRSQKCFFFFILRKALLCLVAAFI
jgi:hypothetical protein